MCGIAGKISTGAPDVRPGVDAMVARMIHRGPDHQAVLPVEPGVVLGHCRLSILDLSAAAHQPMTTADGRFVLSYNGEVYNFLELRTELERRGHRFTTHSDTEVVLAAFTEWGTACFDRFNGMFALAIWDRRERELVLARDRFGKKPLFYTALGGAFSFASELSALSSDPSLHPHLQVSIAGLNHYLAMGYVLAPTTIYQDVHALEPATFARVRDGRVIERTRYWEYREAFAGVRRVSAPDAAADLLTLLDAAVKRRLVSDVPVGAFLSGGIDSSAVVALAARHLQYPLHTFSVGFEGPYDESEDAAAVAAHAGSTHHKHRLAPTEIRELIDVAIDRYDAPFSDTSLVPMVSLAQLTRQYVTVALSGDGADELFGGYATYRADALHQRVAALPSWVRAIAAAGLARAPGRRRGVGAGFKAAQFAKGLPRDGQGAHYAWRELHSEAERIAIIGARHRDEIRDSDPARVFRRYYDEVPDLDALSQHLYVDAKTWLADDVLVKVDRASMAASLEVRCPFLDREVAEYAASLPASLKIGHGEQKHVLKRAIAALVPERTIRKPKAGFNAPINAWLGHRDDDEFRYFNRYVGVRKGLLRPAATERPPVVTTVAGVA